MEISSLMPLVPLIGAVATFIVFSLLMYLCIRNIDKLNREAASDDWLDDDESVEEPRRNRHS